MKTRINLTLTPEANETLERLATRTSQSKSTVMANAIIAYDKQRQLAERTLIYIQDCMPMMADIVSGYCPEPVELPDGADVSHYVAMPDGEVPWTSIAPAWRKLELGDVADACLIACRGREPRNDWGSPCPLVVNTVRELRVFLGEPGAAVCRHGRILVFNSDGTRVAVAERAT